MISKFISVLACVDKNIAFKSIGVALLTVIKIVQDVRLRYRSRLQVCKATSVVASRHGHVHGITQ